MKPALRREIFIFLSFAVLAVFMTWPLLPNAAHSATDTGFDDMLINARFLRLVIDWFIGDRGSGLFDADFFFPHPNVFGTTDPCIGVGLLVLPLRLFTDDAFLLVNLALLLSFPLTAHATYLLARDLTGSTRAAIVSGAAFAFCLYRFHQLDHVSILQMQWLVYALVFLHRLRDRPTFLNGLGLTIFLVLNGLASASIALYSVPVLFLVGLWTVATAPQGGRAKFLRASVLSGLFALLALLPVIRSYLSASDTYGIQRDPDSVKLYSARLEQFVAAPPYNKLYGDALGNLMGLESATFLGVTVLVLAGFGLFFALRRPSVPTPAAKPTFFRSPVALYFLLAIFFSLLSLGPDISLFGERLGTGVWAAVSSLPGFGAVRTPSRFFFVASLAAAILAAFGLAAILTRAATSRIQSLVFALAFVGTLAESWSAPLPLRRYPTHAEAPPVYHWLAAAPGPRRAIVELPISRSLERHSMHFANLHKRPTVNGVSSFNLPSVYWVSHESFRTREAVLHLERLAAAGLQFVVLHRNDIPKVTHAPYLRILERVGARLVATPGADEVYELPPPGAATQPLSRSTTTAFIQIPPAAFPNTPMSLSVHFMPREDAAVFDPTARRFDLRLTARSGGTHVDTTATFFLAPALIVPASVDTIHVDVPVALAPGLYRATLRLTDDRGDLWVQEETSFHVTTREAWQTIKGSLTSRAACRIASVSSHRGSTGERRALVVARNTGEAPWVGATQVALHETQIRANGERAMPRVGKLPPLAPGSAAPVTLNIDESTTAIELEIRSQGSNAPECTHAVAVPGGPRAADGDLNKPAPAPAPPR